MNKQYSILHLCMYKTFALTFKQIYKGITLHSQDMLVSNVSAGHMHITALVSAN